MVAFLVPVRISGPNGEVISFFSKLIVWVPTRPSSWWSGHSWSLLCEDSLWGYFALASCFLLTWIYVDVHWRHRPIIVCNVSRQVSAVMHRRDSLVICLPLAFRGSKSTPSLCRRTIRCLQGPFDAGLKGGNTKDCFPDLYFCALSKTVWWRNYMNTTLRVQDCVSKRGITTETK